MINGQEGDDPALPTMQVYDLFREMGTYIGTGREEGWPGGGVVSIVYRFFFAKRTFFKKKGNF